MPETPWWEGTPEGTPLLLAFVQVVREDLAEDSLQQRDRYIAGVEYVADKLGAAQPLRWRENDVLLLIQADEPHAAIMSALSAAEAIRERAMVDLSMTVRLAVHAARVEWTPDMAQLAPREVSRCEELARATPAQGIAITEDVYRPVGHRAAALRPPGYMEPRWTGHVCLSHESGRESDSRDFRAP
ncbi:hypothetical protein ACN28S_49440 [Cystobacter fuscus]